MEGFREDSMNKWRANVHSLSQSPREINRDLSYRTKMGAMKIRDISPSTTYKGGINHFLCAVQVQDRQGYGFVKPEQRKSEEQASSRLCLMVIVGSWFEKISVHLFAADCHETLVTSSSFTNGEEGRSLVSQLLLVYIRAAQETSKCNRYVSFLYETVKVWLV
jgi:hypothetical protein